MSTDSNRCGARTAAARQQHTRTTGASGTACCWSVTPPPESAPNAPSPCPAHASAMVSARATWQRFSFAYAAEPSHGCSLACCMSLRSSGCVYMPPEDTNTTREGAPATSAGSRRCVRAVVPSTLVAKLASKPSGVVERSDSCARRAQATTVVVSHATRRQPAPSKDLQLNPAKIHVSMLFCLPQLSSSPPSCSPALLRCSPASGGAALLRASRRQRQPLNPGCSHHIPVKHQSSTDRWGLPELDLHMSVTAATALKVARTYCQVDVAVAAGLLDLVSCLLTPLLVSAQHVKRGAPRGDGLRQQKSRPHQHLGCLRQAQQWLPHLGGFEAQPRVCPGHYHHAPSEGVLHAAAGMGKGCEGEYGREGGLVLLLLLL